MARRFRSPAPTLPGLAVPGQKPIRARRVDVEGPIHMGILNWLRWALPGALIHHSPNAMNLAADPKSKAIAQSKARALGMVKGFPDLLVIWRGEVWGIEVKAPGGKLSPEQIAVGESFVANGLPWGVAASIDEAAALVDAWLGDSPLRAAVRAPLRRRA